MSAVKATSPLAATLLGLALLAPAATATAAAPTAARVALADADPNTIEPTIVGAPQVGVRLEVRHGEIRPFSTVTYQWFRDDVPIAGGRGTYYTLGDIDVGARIHVLVTAVSATAGTRTWLTPEVGPVVGVLAALNPGVIRGEALIGRPLLALPPAWSTSGATTRYQWLLDGKPIRGASGARFTPGKAHLGGRLSVRYTGSARGYTPAEATSSLTPRVGKARGVLKARYRAGKVLITLARTGAADGGQVKVRTKGRTHNARIRQGRASVTVGTLKRGTRVDVTYLGTKWIQQSRITLRR